MVVSNRLPVDRCSADETGCEDGWRRSPGGLVTALAPMMTKTDGAWVGWHGAPDETVKPFSHGGIDLIPVQLSTEDIELFYEGFSNATLWPLYHDVIAPPEFHRTWWDSLPEGQPAVRRRRHPPCGRGRHRLGAGLPAPAGPQAAPRGPAGPEDRVLQPHPLPAAGDLRPAPVAPRDHRRPAGRGPGGLPAQQRRRKLHALRPALPGRQRQAAAGPRQGHRRRDHPHRQGPGVPDLHRRQADQRAGEAAGRHRARRSRSAGTSATPRPSCSASTGSTTPRASGTGSRRTRSCCRTARSPSRTRP